MKQTSFQDAKKTTQDSALIGPPTLEFAPYNRIPGGRRRNDQRQGQIDQDPDFQQFLEDLTNPAPAKAKPEEAVQEKEKVKTTPLIEAIREKKAQKDKPKEKGGKHNRGESRDAKTDRAADKRVSPKTVKDGKPNPEDKKQTRQERAAKEAVKVLNKEAAAAKPGVNAAVDGNAPGPSSAAPERRRERGNASIAAKMLQRDLGIGPAAGRMRGGRRDRAPEAATQAAEKAGDSASATSATGDRAAQNNLHSPRQQNRQAVRNDRRAQQIAPAKKPDENTNPGATASTAPTILKKPPTGPAAQNQQPPQGPAASRTRNEPTPAKSSSPAQTPATQASTAPKPAAPVPMPASRHAFLKHANPSQGITEPLIEAALSIFGGIERVEIDKRKGFAYVDFANPETLQKAIIASPIKIAQGAVQVLEKKDKPVRPGPPVNAAGAAGPPAGPTGPRGPSTPPIGPAFRGGHMAGPGFRGGRGSFRGRGGRGGFVGGAPHANPTAAAGQQVAAAAATAQSNTASPAPTSAAPASATPGTAVEASPATPTLQATDVKT